LEPNDIELLIAFQERRDDSALARIVDRRYPWIRATARRRLGDGHLADDAVRSVFVILAEKAPYVPPGDPPIPLVK